MCGKITADDVTRTCICEIMLKFFKGNRLAGVVDEEHRSIFALNDNDDCKTFHGTLDDGGLEATSAIERELKRGCE